jgi:two-component system response regulator (stage 0 sporulation protein F)
MDDSLITVKDVADYLKLKEQTVYLLARQNKIPSLKVGGSLRFKKSQIDSWLSSRADLTKQTSNQQRVLIVDDEEPVRSTLKRMVELHGVLAVAAQSGPDAVEKARQHAFRLVFLDLNMPGMNGVETLKALKEIDRALRVVVVTALTGEDELFRSIIELGPVSMIPKPFTIQHISDVLGLYLENLSRPNPSALRI